MCRNQKLSSEVSATLSAECRNSICTRRTTGDISTVKGVQRPLVHDPGNRKSGRRCFLGDMTDAMSYTRFRVMVFVLLCMLTGCGGGEQGHSSPVEEINPDIAVLLDKISAICADRWTIGIGEHNMIHIESDEKVLGSIVASGYSGADEEYILVFHFKIVNKVTPQQASDRLRRMDDLREKAKAIGHTRTKVTVRYEPHGQDQWALVLRVRKAEEKVRDIPEYRYESVWLSEDDYSMKFFIPNKQNSKALQYKQDIDGIFKLLTKLEEDAP